MEILIIEDEVRAANQLQKMLSECKFEYELLDIIDTVEDSVKWFESGRTPKLVFMDIQLADGLSFEIFQKIEVDIPIIFITAFDQYAIQAFKVNSVDYLLKPIQKEALEQALGKFQKSNQQQKISPLLLKEMLEAMQAPQARHGILVKDGSGFMQIKTTELLYVYSEDSITFGVTSSKRYIIDETLDQLYSTLDAQQFFRINRGQIIAKNSVMKMEAYFNHRVKLVVDHPRDQEFIVSRPKTSEFKDWMNK